MTDYFSQSQELIKEIAQMTLAKVPVGDWEMVKLSVQFSATEPLATTLQGHYIIGGIEKSCLVDFKIMPLVKELREISNSEKGKISGFALTIDKNGKFKVENTYF